MRHSDREFERSTSQSLSNLYDLERDKELETIQEFIQYRPKMFSIRDGDMVRPLEYDEISEFRVEISTAPTKRTSNQPKQGQTNKPQVSEPICLD